MTPFGSGMRFVGVRYPNAYVWYVFLAALDIMLTWTVLHYGGWEVNTLADWVIEHWDLPGLALYKFTLVMIVIGVCEIVGRRNDPLGRRLSEWAVAITAIPVVLALLQLLMGVHC